VIGRLAPPLTGIRLVPNPHGFHKSTESLHQCVRRSTLGNARFESHSMLRHHLTARSKHLQVVMVINQGTLDA
jgi:hypothetical protein